MPSEDSKPLKREEVEEDDDDERSLGSILRDKGKKKPVSTSNAASKLPKPNKTENVDFDSPQKKPTPKSVKAKKEESPAIGSNDDKPNLKKSVAKDDKSKSKMKEVVKKKEDVKNKKNEGETKKRERKVYDLPGQKRDAPEERDPLRIFYESLYEQVPESDMAAIWMMESGLLPKDVAKQVYERKQKKSQMQKFGSPMKASVSATKRGAQSSKSVPVKRAKDSSSTPSNMKKTTLKAATATMTKKRKKDESSEEESEEEDSEDDFDISKMVSKRQKT